MLNSATSFFIICYTPIAALQNLQRPFVCDARHDLYVGTINRTRLERIQSFHFTFFVFFLVSFDSTSNNIIHISNWKCSINIWKKKKKNPYVISYHNCPKNSRETCLKSIFELLVHSCGSTGFMKLSKDSFSAG